MPPVGREQACSGTGEAIAAQAEQWIDVPFVWQGRVRAGCDCKGLVAGVVAVKDAGTGDWALSWVRRTRIGGAWTSGTPIPLGEASEAYVVEILNGGAVVRTITGLTSAAATWTAAQQTTDFGSGQSSVSWRVYQISDTVGRGFAAAA